MRVEGLLMSGGRCAGGWRVRGSEGLGGRGIKRGGLLLGCGYGIGLVLLCESVHCGFYDERLRLRLCLRVVSISSIR